MKRIILVFLLVFGMISFAYAEEAWLQFNLKEKSYTDIHGNILKSIEGRRNIPGVDEFKGGGKTGYPNLENFTISDRYEKGFDLLIKGKGNVSNLISQGGKKRTDDEARDLKKTVFGISEMVTSGVSN